MVMSESNYMEDTKIPVRVSNYTADNEDMCLCVKLYRSYLR